MRKLLPLTAGVLLAVGGLAPAAASASPTTTAAPTRATAPYCGITWGSSLKTAPAHTGATVNGVRAGRHDCYDRLVVYLDLGPGPVTGYSVEYVPHVFMGGAGHPIPLAGAADLSIRVQAPAYDSAGDLIWDPLDWWHAVDVTGFTTFRQVALADPYGGETLMGLGVRARLPFRVMVLPGPGSGSRLVVDVAHRW
jgi:hypothetical protein